MEIAGFETGVKSPEVVGAKYQYIGQLKERRYFWYAGLLGNLKFGVHNNSINNARRGLYERVFHVEKDGKFVPTPKPTVSVRTELRLFTAALTQRLPKTAPILHQAFPEYYTGRRKDIYQRAADELEVVPLNKGDALLRSFVKAEKVNLSKKPDPAPRLIQPRSPRFNVAVGCFIKHLEKPLYASIAGVFRGPTVLKGYNAEQSGRILRDMWEEYRDPVAVDLDATRFDQHVSMEMLQWEHSVYLSCFRGDDKTQLRRLLAQQLQNRGIIKCPDGIIKYKVDGCRMSGDMNTAMGNCLIMCALVWTYCKERGVKARLANNGDDCVLICERGDIPTLTNGLFDWFLRFGFQIKVGDIVDEFEKITFCQMQPLWDGSQWLLVRDPHISMSKDRYTIVPLTTPKLAAGWLHGFGMAGMSLTGGIPVLQEYYNCMLRSGLPNNVQNSTQWENASGFLNLSKGMARQVTKVTDAARLSYWRAFGVCPARQELVESILRNTTLSLHRDGFQVLDPTSEINVHSISY